MMARKLFSAALSAAALLAVTPVPAHEGHHSPVPWQACQDKQLDDPCEFRNTARDLYRGSCREVQRQLICVRNQPITRSAAAPGQLEPPWSEALQAPWKLPDDIQYEL
ncbi:MAG: hypothetical protein KDI21_12180 [Halieaceae bacterium]|nr:hypothetical protein [Halieaceae bacterium]